MITNEGVLAINKALLKDSFLTTRAMTEKFNLVAFSGIIRKYLKLIVWKNHEHAIFKWGFWEKSFAVFVYI